MLLLVDLSANTSGGWFRKDEFPTYGERKSKDRSSPFLWFIPNEIFSCKAWPFVPNFASGSSDIPQFYLIFSSLTNQPIAGYHIINMTEAKIKAQCEDCQNFFYMGAWRCVDPEMLNKIGIRLVDEPPPWLDPQNTRLFFRRKGQESEGCYPNDLPACETILVRHRIKPRGQL